MKKFIITLLSCLLVLGLACGCTKEDPTPTPTPTEKTYTTVKEGVLTVSMSTDYAPFEFIDLTKKGQEMFVGSDVKIAQTIANYLGLELEIKSMDFDAAMVALDQGIVDLCIEGLSWSPSREAAYAFSNAYTTEEDAYQAIVVLKEKVDNYPTLASLNDAAIKVGVQKATIQKELAEIQIPNCTLNEFAKYDDAWVALKAGSLDVVCCDSKVFFALNDKEPDTYALAGETFEWTMKGKYALAQKDNVELIKVVNEALATIDQKTFDVWTDEALALYAQLGDNAAEEIVTEQE